MKRTYKTNKMESMIDNFLNQSKISDGIFNVKINKAWKNSVGNKIYSYTKSIYFKKGNLFIEVDNPILKQEINYIKNGGKLIFHLPIFHIIDKDNYKKYLKKNFKSFSFL